MKKEIFVWWCGLTDKERFKIIEIEYNRRYVPIEDRLECIEDKINIRR